MKKIYCKRARLAALTISAVLILIPSGVYASGTDESDASAAPGEARSVTSEMETPQNGETIASGEDQSADGRDPAETELTQPEEDTEGTDSEPQKAEREPETSEPETSDPESPDSNGEGPMEPDSENPDPEEVETEYQEPDDTGTAAGETESRNAEVEKPEEMDSETSEPVIKETDSTDSETLKAEDQNSEHQESAGSETEVVIVIHPPVQSDQTEKTTQAAQTEKTVQIVQTTEEPEQTAVQPAVQVPALEADPLPRNITDLGQAEPVKIVKAEEKAVPAGNETKREDAAISESAAEESKTSEKQPEDDRSPEIQIFGVEDHSANREPLLVSVKFRDENLLGESVYAYLTATGSGKRTDAVVQKETQTGVVLTFPEINKDDYYVLTTGCRDRAGNETVQTVSFTENRKGAVVSLKNVSLKDSTLSQPGVVPEFRIAGIDEVTEVTADVNGKSVPVKFNKEGNLILTDPLTEEGEYTVRLRTKDASGNEVSSEPVTFAIDRTKPSLSVKKSRNTNSKQQDSFEVVISKDRKEDRFTEILLDGRQLKEEDYTTLKDGSIQVRVSGSGQHTVRVTAGDTAGNTETMSRTFSVTGKNKQNGRTRCGIILFLIGGTAGAAVLIRFKNT